MNETMYMLIMKVFMVIMPVSLAGLVVFAGSCIKTKATDHPAFWMTLMCISILTSEIVRGFLILHGDMPPHPKHLLMWMVQLMPFGGLMYAIIARYCKVAKDRFFNND